MYDKDMPRDEHVTLWGFICGLMAIILGCVITALGIKTGIADTRTGPYIVFGGILLTFATCIMISVFEEEIKGKFKKIFKGEKKDKKE